MRLPELPLNRSGKIDPVLQNFVVGVIIIVAVGLDQLRRTRMFRTQGRR